MIKHYEQLWEDAEVVATQWYESDKSKDVAEDLENLAKMYLSLGFDNFSQEEKEEWMGNMLITLCYLSKKHNINTYAVLKDGMNDLKIETLDPDINLDI